MTNLNIDEEITALGALIKNETPFNRELWVQFTLVRLAVEILRLELEQSRAETRAVLELKKHC